MALRVERVRAAPVSHVSLLSPALLSPALSLRPPPLPSRPPPSPTAPSSCTAPSTTVIINALPIQLLHHSICTCACEHTQTHTLSSKAQLYHFSLWTPPLHHHHPEESLAHSRSSILRTEGRAQWTRTAPLIWPHLLQLAQPTEKDGTGQARGLRGLQCPSCPCPCSGCSRPTGPPRE